MPLYSWLILSAVFLLILTVVFISVAPLLYLSLLAFGILVFLLYKTHKKLEHRSQISFSEHQITKDLLALSHEFYAILSPALVPTYQNPSFSKIELLPSGKLAIYHDEKSPDLLLPDIISHTDWQGEAWLKLNTNNQRIAVNLTLAPHNKSPNFLLIAQPIGTLKQQQNADIEQSIYDTQTGLYTPQVLNQFIQNAINSVSAQLPQFALCLIKFTPVLDDSSSLPYGDISDVIKSLSTHLKPYSDQGVIISRYSNDTVALLYPAHLNSAQIEVNLNRLAHNLQHCAKQACLAFEQSSLQTFIGVSIYPLDATTPSGLINSAAKAIYSAAKLGRSNTQFSNSRFQLTAPEYLALENELTKAQLNGEFDVYYQPRVSISSNRVIGYEALLRWHNPKRGLLIPQYFLNVADETSLIIALDRLVFAKCCKQLSMWLKNGYNRGRMSINVSSLSFRQYDFVSNLCSQLELYNVSADQFELELDEDVFLQADSTLKSTLQQLVKLGFHLSLDNFGQGVSSLSVLREFPLHSIKISQTFIREMEHNEQQRNITASLIRLASYLQLDVIATGIENEMQAYLLHVMGCDILQGHLYSKALPASEIPPLLAKEHKLVNKVVG